MKNDYLKKVGAPSQEELSQSFNYPKKEDFEKGPIAVIECIEPIPCNPCEASCPKKAIVVGNPITNLPQIDFKKCIGCGKCIAVCPGLAIYIKYLHYSIHEALISFPYEFFPLPNEGEVITLIGREGQEICDGKVIKVNHSKKNNHTTIISVAYNKKYFYDVVNMKRNL